jgi:LPS sulfotransferase NodH
MTAERSYLVCATPRSGSTLVCQALKETGVAGRPEEYFEALRKTGRPRRPEQYFVGVDDESILDHLGERNVAEDPQPRSPLWSRTAYDRYIDWAMEVGTTPNGVFGAKLMWGYFGDFVGLLRNIPRFRDLPLAQLLPSAFPDVTFVRVVRANKIRQAVSLWKAVQTQDWKREDVQTGARPRAVPTFSFSAIDHLVHQLIAHDAAWDGYFMGMGLEPLVVTYEELAEAHEPVVRRVLEHIGVAAPDRIVDARPRLSVQADGLSEEWTRRYAELAREEEPATSTPGPGGQADLSPPGR